MSISLKRLHECLERSLMPSDDEIRELLVIAIDGSAEPPADLKSQILTRGNTTPLRITPRTNWEARVMTMRAARKLADRLESMAQDAIESNPEEPALFEAQLDQSFRTLFASLTALLESLPNAEKRGK